jgi:GT2 family glycosyltransferase
MVRVTVGIVTYNSLHDLPACLAALHAQTYPAITITVVDNASSDETVAWVKAHYPDVWVIENAENVGFGRAHNQAMAGVADYYLALNPDAELEPDYIARLVEALERSDPAFGFAVGKLRLKNPNGERTLYSAGHALTRSGYAFNIGYGLNETPDLTIEREVFGAPGAAALYSGRLIGAIGQGAGLFDPDIFLYGEDTDVDWRARRAGWRCLYVPTAEAYHRGSSPRPELNVLIIGNRYLSAVKNSYPLDLWTLVIPLLILHCAARLVVTPRFGVRLIRHVIREWPRFWRKRGRAALPRSEMLKWYRWSKMQPSVKGASVWRRVLARLRR